LLVFTKYVTLLVVGGSMAQQSLPPAEPTVSEVLVRDPLSAVTRKERLYLLAISLIGIAMVRTGLVPSKIATFGIELDKPNRSALLFLLALVTIYFLGAFILYAASDWNARYEALSAARYRIYTTRRYQEMAYALYTSEENIRRLYDVGELEDFAYQKLAQPDRDAKDRLERILGWDYESFMEKDRPDQAKQLVQVFETPPTPPTLTLVSYPARIRIVATSRVFFEFILPVLVGGYTIYELLARSLFG
jgi:hypothetical protein